MPDTNEFPNSDKESIMIERSTKGIYTWSIKLKETAVTEDTVERLVALDSKLKIKFPQVGAN